MGLSGVPDQRHSRMRCGRRGRRRRRQWWEWGRHHHRVQHGDRTQLDKHGRRVGRSARRDREQRPKLRIFEYLRLFAISVGWTQRRCQRCHHISSVQGRERAVCDCRFHGFAGCGHYDTGDDLHQHKHHLDKHHNDHHDYAYHDIYSVPCGLRGIQSELRTGVTLRLSVSDATGDP